MENSLDIFNCICLRERRTSDQVHGVADTFEDRSSVSTARTTENNYFAINNVH